MKRQIFKFDNFRLDAENRSLRLDGNPVSLPAKAFDLLQMLLENNGRLVSKDEILSRVWQDQFVEEANLTVSISALRKVLGETKKNPKYIETVPGYGYRFIGEVSDEDAEMSRRGDVEKERRGDEKVLENSKLISQSPNLSIFFTQKLAIGALLLILAVIGGAWFLNQTKNSSANLPVVSAEKKSKIKRLTSIGDVHWGLLSPDGKFFAYTFRKKGNFQTGLRIGQTSSNSNLQLLPNADLVYFPRSFSADGNWLYYTASKPREFDNGTLYKISVLGGIPQKLVEGISVYPVFSPDEKRIAFVRNVGENKSSALVTANLDGSDEREISMRPAGQSFIRNSLSWSADGARLAFGAEIGKGGNLEVFSANVADGSVKQITSSDWLSMAGTAWLRDGKGLIVVARDKDSFAANQIWRIDYESGKAQKISSDLQHYGIGHNLSADSSMLLARQTTVESSIWIAPAENPAEARQITFSSAGHEGWYGIDWTPDSKIIYTKRVDQSLTIWSMDTLGANAVQLTSAGFLDDRPAVTVDGKYIVFQSNRSGETEIWRMNSDGSDLRRITFDGKNTVPHFTPDGKTIVYMHNAEGKNFAYRVSIEGGEAVKITDADIYNPRVSPDGNFITGGHQSDGKTKLAIFSINGGAPLKLFDVPPTHNFNGSIRWSRDGKSIIYRDWADGIWSQSIEGGAPAQLKGLPKEKLLQFDWSPDSKQIAFVRERIQSDLVLLTDFR